MQRWKVGKAYWKDSHSCFYCVVTHPNGRREERRLDPDRHKADVARSTIVTNVQRHERPTADFTVRALCNAFLDYSKANNAPATYEWYMAFVKPFAESLPHGLRVRDFNKSYVQSWLAHAYPATGNTNTRHDAVSAVKRVFNWAANDMEYFDHNPLARLKKPQKKPRSGCLSRKQWDEVLSHFAEGSPFRDFLEILLLTGCRPQEARVLTAKHINWETRRAHFAEGEVPGKKGERDILLTEAALVILRKWALRYPKGPLLRNEKGGPWQPAAINSRFVRLRKKLSFNAHAYLTRHSVATDMLEAGASAGAVAAVLGHQSPTMVLEVYGKHIEEREQHLRDALERATTKPSGPP